jgi:broad specificity phosphatase PhoE
LPSNQLNSVIANFFSDQETEASPGWERATDAGRRFLLAAVDLLYRFDRGTVVICSGGRVLTVVLQQLALVDQREILGTWRRIRMPDTAVIELGLGRSVKLLRNFGEADPVDAARR